MTLKEVYKKIKELENSTRVRIYQKKNPQKTKESRDKWNKKHRNEYQREYYKSKKPTNEKTNNCSINSDYAF